MKFVIVICLLVTVNCSSRSLAPEKKEVVMAREAPNKNCKEMGKISGTTATAKGTPQQALDDLSEEAANKGANFVWIKEFSGNRTTVTGIAYDCP